MATYKNWRLERDEDGIAWLYFDKAGAGANVLSKTVLEELDSALNGLLDPSPTGVVILSAKDNGFIAGADVKEFTAIKDEGEALALIRRGQGIMDRIGALPFPSVALIHGFCLGGGLELALACDYRVARDDPGTRLGLPEVLLGIHPGFGGSVRLTRLIGGPAAMGLMLTGRTLDSRRAKRLGLVDLAVPQRHWKRAAARLILDQAPKRQAKALQRASNLPLVRPVLALAMRRQVAAKARKEHYPAPYALIDVWARHGGDPRAMLRAEAESVARLLLGGTAQNLVRVFFLQERLKGLGKASAFTPRRVHVIGAGVMGGDIAAWCAGRGLQVTVQDNNPAALARVVGRAHKLYQQRLKDRRRVRDAMDRLIPDRSGAGVGRADVIIEAIFENVDAKQGLFREIEPQARPEALLATNTSSIPLETLGEALHDPGRLVGVHFFNPVAKMQLVEVVSGASTGPAWAEKGAAFVRRIDRLPLPVKSSPGFLVNRVLMPYLLEAVSLVEEGVPPAVIDKAATDFGMPMGPILLADTVGLDICLSVAEILGRELHHTVPGRLREMVEAGRLGKKSGQGFYAYDKGKALVPKIDRSYAAPADLTERLILRLINEAVACLREGVVADKDLLDAGMIFGTGFAPFRGGPLRSVESTGAEAVYEQLAGLEKVHGERFQPDEGWTELR
ncbi:MAG TPA: crotonase [Gammaproteobacteria bacterium]|nr:crotonase [Gammaproteobacteria bacterium]